MAIWARPSSAKATHASHSTILIPLGEKVIPGHDDHDTLAMSGGY